MTHQTSSLRALTLPLALAALLCIDTSAAAEPRPETGGKPTSQPSQAVAAPQPAARPVPRYAAARRVRMGPSLRARLRGRRKPSSRRHQRQTSPAKAKRPTHPALSGQRPVGWGEGESMTYAVSLAGLEAARAALSVGRARRRGDRTVLTLRGLGETVPFISAFARLREEVVTSINLAGVLPLRSVNDRSSSQRGKDRWLATDYGGLTDRRIKQQIKQHGRNIRRARRIPTPLHDPISALFALRSARLRKGDKLRLLVITGNNLWAVAVEVKGKERIYSRLGPQDTIRIDGVGHRVRDDGRTRVPGKDPRSVSMWLSADALRLPIRLRGDTDLGPLEAELTSHRAPRRGLRVRVALARGVR